MINFLHFLLGKNILLSKEYKKKKIENIQFNEIQKDLKKLNLLYKNKIDFRVSKLDENLFQIHKK